MTARRSSRALPAGLLKFDTMPCRDLAPLFRGAAKIKAERNNAAASGGASLTQDRGYLGKGYDQPKAGGKRPM